MTDLFVFVFVFVSLPGSLSSNQSTVVYFFFFRCLSFFETDYRISPFCSLICKLTVPACKRLRGTGENIKNSREAWNRFWESDRRT